MPTRASTKLHLFNNCSSQLSCTAISDIFPLNLSVSPKSLNDDSILEKKAKIREMISFARHFIYSLSDFRLFKSEQTLGNYWSRTT